MEHKNACSRADIQYTRLGVIPHEIRLLTIESGENTDQDFVISCSLKHHILDSAPEFDALSYHWGDPCDTVPILVDGCVFHATRTLVDALKALRKVGRKIVWADAICINQRDDEERALQVLRMASLYRAATTVCVWLGPAQDGSDVVMDAISSHQNSGIADYRWHFIGPIDWSLKPSKDDFIDIEHTLRSPVRGYLQALLARPYWERLWILQEVSLGSRVEVYCGDHAVDWHALTKALLSARIAFPEAFSRLESIMSLRQNLSNNQPPLFFTALCNTYTAKATLPRDKMYGLLGITLDGPRLFPAPSYIHSHETIFQNLAFMQILSQRSLDFILLRGLGSPSPLNLPSWVPDWLALHPGTEGWRLATYIRDSFSSTGLTKPNKRWSASGESIVTQSSISTKGSKLRVKGQFITTITRIGNVYKGGRLAKPSSEASIPNLRESAQSPPDSATGVVEALRETLAAGADPSYISFENNRMEMLHYEDILQWLWSQEPDCAMWLLRHKHFPIMNKTLGDWIKLNDEDWALDAPSLMQAVNHPRAALRHFSRRCETEAMGLFVRDCLRKTLELRMKLFTSVGGWFGWAHRAVELGDQLFLLEGCSLPVILRPFDCEGIQRFGVVGDAFVPGLMRGKLWGREELEPIELV